MTTMTSGTHSVVAAFLTKFTSLPLHTVSKSFYMSTYFIKYLLLSKLIATTIIITENSDFLFKYFVFIFEIIDLFDLCSSVLSSTF